MSIDKEPMSAAYSAVFILSILMMLAVFFGSAFAQSKAGGFGVWVWGYTAWLMKKRRNSDLATLFKFLMWLSVVGLAACALLFLNSADRSNGGNAVDVVVTALSLLLCIAIEYGLYTFFKKQVNAALVPIQSRPTSDESVRPPVNGETTGTNTNSSFVTPMARGTPSAAHTNSAAPFLNVTPQGHSHLPTATPFSTVAVEGQPSTTDLAVEALYEKALNELSTGKKPGLWAMALAQTANGGNPDGAYIALRVKQLLQEYAGHQQSRQSEVAAVISAPVSAASDPVDQSIQRKLSPTQSVVSTTATDDPQRLRCGKCSQLTSVPFGATRACSFCDVAAPLLTNDSCATTAAQSIEAAALPMATKSDTNFIKCTKCNQMAHVPVGATRACSYCGINAPLMTNTESPRLHV